MVYGRYAGNVGFAVGRVIMKRNTICAIAACAVLLLCGVVWARGGLGVVMVGGQGASVAPTGSWYYYSGKSESSFTSYESPPDPYDVGVPITLPTGTCTKLGWKIDDLGSATNVKLGIRNASGTLLSECVGASRGVSGAYYFECTLSQAVTAGTYLISGQPQSKSIRIYIDTDANGLYWYCTYANSIYKTDANTGSSDTGHLHGVRAYVE